VHESEHVGDVAVCDADGNLIAFAGDPRRRLFSRSCMKPLQGAVSLHAMGGSDDLSDRLVAIMCASHNGEPVHVDAVRELLQLGDLTEDDLRNPPDYPLDADSTSASEGRRRILQNCSGKHAGKLVACVRAGWDRAVYLDPGHPLQQQILDAVRSGTGVGDPAIGVDGCGAPVHAVELADMATLYARLVRPERLGALEPTVHRATSAMLAQPYMVAGRHRLATALMERSTDLIEKGGAEGLSCTASFSAGLGIAVKTADGSARALPPAVLGVLRQLDLVDDATLASMPEFARPPVFGGGRPVGAIDATVELHRP